MELLPTLQCAVFIAENLSAFGGVQRFGSEILFGRCQPGGWKEMT